MLHAKVEVAITNVFKLILVVRLQKRLPPVKAMFLGIEGLPCAPIAGNAKSPPGSLGEFKWDGASGCYMVIDRKQETFFVLLEQTPSDRQLIQRTGYETMAN